MSQGVWFGLLLMSTATAVSARTCYVATDGSDQNPGSRTEPLQTIQKAAGAARAGDTIIVRGGVYRECVVLRFSGQQGKPIALKNCPGEQVVIQPGENLVATEDNAYEAINNNQTDQCVVDADSFNFHLRAGSPAIGAGFPDRAPTTDFDGKRRPQGGMVDIGAYEFSPATGPLRVHPANPRYFSDGTKNADGSLKVVYLTGSHTWNNLVDMGKADPPTAFDFEAYLKFLQRYGHNFIRLWTWDSVAWDTRANRKLGKEGRFQRGDGMAEGAGYFEAFSR